MASNAIKVFLTLQWDYLAFDRIGLHSMGSTPDLSMSHFSNSIELNYIYQWYLFTFDPIRSISHWVKRLIQKSHATLILAGAVEKPANSSRAVRPVRDTDDAWGYTSVQYDR